MFSLVCLVIVLLGVFIYIVGTIQLYKCRYYRVGTHSFIPPLPPAKVFKQRPIQHTPANSSSSSIYNNSHAINQTTNFTRR